MDTRVPATPTAFVRRRTAGGQEASPRPFCGARRSFSEGGKPVYDDCAYASRAKPRSIILQEPLDVIELDLRTGRIGEPPAQFFQNPTDPLHVDFAGDLDREIVGEFVVAHRPAERIGAVLRALLAAPRVARAVARL